MTSDQQPCPKCHGRGSVVLVGKAGWQWVEVRCECTGPVFDASEEYDPDRHLCETCGGLKVQRTGRFVCLNCRP